MEPRFLFDKRICQPQDGKATVRAGFKKLIITKIPAPRGAGKFINLKRRSFKMNTF